MTVYAWTFLAGLALAITLLVVVLRTNEDLLAENRRLRARRTTYWIGDQQITRAEFQHLRRIR